MSDTNGKAQVSAYNKITFAAGTILPDAPIGAWGATIVRGKGRVSPTKGGDPMITLQVRLDAADDEANESYQGTQLPLRFVFFGDTDGSKPGFAKRRTKTALADLCAQTGVDLDLIPEVMEDPENDLRPFIEAVEGKSLQVWTSHRPNKDTGETMVEVNLRAPGNFGGTQGSGRE